MVYGISFEWENHNSQHGEGKETISEYPTKGVLIVEYTEIKCRVDLQRVLKMHF